MSFSDHDGSHGVERRLHAMRGDAARAPDLTDGILSRIERERPFADARQLRLRRWGRLVGMAFAGGLAVCAGVVAVQWKQIAPGLAGPQPVARVVSGAVADVRAGSLSIRTAPERLVQLARGEARTDPEDSTVVRSVAANVIVPMSAALQVPPTLEPSEAEQNLAQRVIAGGQRMLNRAERLASAALKGGSGMHVDGDQTFADRLGRAVGGAPLGDSGPQ
ncbi:MAG TPA: hypothetical protein VFF65_09900 [Phycisphaerales bacterium]|nr:hypothetical protein [Phycisphaerales bacterium]